MNVTLPTKRAQDIFSSVGSQAHLAVASLHIDQVAFCCVTTQAQILITQSRLKPKTRCVELKAVKDTHAINSRTGNLGPSISLNKPLYCTFIFLKLQILVIFLHLAVWSMHNQMMCRMQVNLSTFTNASDLYCFIGLVLL